MGLSQNCNTPAISPVYLNASCPSNREGLLGRPWGAPGCPFYFPSADPPFLSGITFTTEKREKPPTILFELSTRWWPCAVAGCSFRSRDSHRPRPRLGADREWQRSLNFGICSGRSRAHHVSALADCALVGFGAVEHHLAVASVVRCEI